MVTLQAIGNTKMTAPLDLVGLSSDTLPTDKIGGYTITNGSQFLAMDTSQIFMFDAENKVWYEL